MAKEANIQSSLQITKGNLKYQSLPVTFTATVDGTKGPTPGSITVSVYGTNVDLSQLSRPGLCRLMNLDAVNFVEYGIWDDQLDILHPLGEILPGESYVLRLSRNLAEEYGTGTGTGTTQPAVNKLRLRANKAACVCLIEVFEA